MMLASLSRRTHSGAPSVAGTAIRSDLLFGRVVPALFWEVLLVGKLLTIAHYLQSGPGNLSSFAFSVVVLQQSLTAGLTAFFAILSATRRPVVGPRGSLGSRAVATAGTFVLAIPVSHGVFAGQTGVLLASAGLLVVGALIAGTGLLALGRCFGIFPEARGLVTRGPYRWVRHPVYLGEIVMATGIVTATFSPAMAGLILALCVLQAWRARLEEQTLTIVFPEYRDYARHTWRLVPLLY
jgi:protein-S-isoprenylcysteine O-methyltransferase Ste14